MATCLPGNTRPCTMASGGRSATLVGAWEGGVRCARHLGGGFRPTRRHPVQWRCGMGGSFSLRAAERRGGPAEQEALQAAGAGAPVAWPGDVRRLPDNTRPCTMAKGGRSAAIVGAWEGGVRWARPHQLGPTTTPIRVPSLCQRLAVVALPLSVLERRGSGGPTIFANLIVTLCSHSEALTLGVNSLRRVGLGWRKLPCLHMLCMSTLCSRKVAHESCGPRGPRSIPAGPLSPQWVVRCDL